MSLSETGDNSLNTCILLPDPEPFKRLADDMPPKSLVILKLIQQDPTGGPVCAQARHMQNRIGNADPDRHPQIGSGPQLFDSRSAIERTGIPRSELVWAAIGMAAFKPSNSKAE